MNFEAFLTRADDEVLQELLGVRALRLLRALDPQGFSPARQRELLLTQSKAQDLLSDKKNRQLLLDLLRQEEAVQLCQVLGFDVGDPFGSLRGARFGNDQEAALLDFFELTKLPNEEVLEIEATRTIDPHYALFEHQAQAARKVLKDLHSGRRRTLLHMPTGSGKTRTAMNIIAQEFRRNPDAAIVWLAHSEELCEQAAAEFEKAWSFLGSHSIPVHRFWGGRSLDTSSIGGHFVVAGLPKMHALVRSNLKAIGEIGKYAGMVIIDEAHQAIAPTYQLILDALVEPFDETSLLGLSATPGRSWNDVDRDAELSDFFARKKVVLEIDGYDNPVEYLVDKGYLAKANFRPAFHETGFDLSDQDRLKIEEEFKVPRSVLENLAEDETRNLVILSSIEDLVQRHNRLVVFATTVEHSDLLAYVLSSRGFWAKSVTGSTPSQERTQILKEFKSASEEPRIVCNYGVLTTGFDAPQTSATVIARPTSSLVLYSQMVGRAIRGPEAGGNSEAEIVTVVDSALPGFGDVGEAFLNWEDVWESK